MTTTTNTLPSNTPPSQYRPQHKAGSTCSATPISDRLSLHHVPTTQPVLVRRTSDHMAADIEIHAAKALSDYLERRPFLSA